jgi:alpha-ketoglutarate-dependent taurine dioxygenase
VKGPHDWAPAEIWPADAGTEASARGLAGYLGAASDLDALLISKKALVFRGFRIGRHELDGILDLILPGRLAYVHGNSPRTKVGDNVYTSTEYPPTFTISMHNEMSYASRWPAKLAFYCERAAASGGATPLVDGTRWLADLDEEVRDAFADGVCYQQNLHGGMGLGRSWQETFEADSREEVEKYLSGASATWKWRSDGGLQVRQVGPATARHRVTGDEVWFNQADQWHPAGLGDETAAALTAIMPQEELPQSVTFANGDPIPAEYITQVQQRGLAAAVDVEWRPGDLLVIDNVLVGHGRRPFTGSRRVLVAMSR